MRIEKAVPGQLEAIGRIEGLCFSDPWEPEILRQEFEHFYVCLDGGAVRGYIVLRSVLDEGSIDNVAVDPAFRRSGIGDALVDFAVGKARREGLAVIYLEVRAGNVPALRLYEKHGFEAVGRRKNYYFNPTEDAVLMTAVL